MKTQNTVPGKKGVRGIFGFTLVELILVITILVILGTIAFINLGGFSGSARDSARISNLTNLKKGLDIYQIKTGTYPMPEGPVTINASGSTILGYQGFAKEIVGSVAKLSNGATKDPSDATIFTTYSVNANQTKMQAMVFLEDASSVTALNLPLPLGEGWGEGFGRGVSSFIPTTFASISSDYSKRISRSTGDSLGILLGNSTGSLNQPVQELLSASFTGVDVMTTQSGYTAYFSSQNSISGTGTRLMSLKASYTQKNDPIIYDSSLVGYWDMETLTPDGKLADLSGNGNSGSGAGGIVLGGVDGNERSGKATSFDGTNDYIDLGTFDPSSGNMTLSFWLYKDTYPGHPEEIIGKRDGWTAPLLDHRWAFYVHNNLLKYGVYGTEVVTNNQIKLSSWNNYTFSYVSGTGNTSNSKWYENGVLAGSGPGYLFANKTNASIVLGRAGNANAEYLLGKLDEVRIYNRALSASEIQTLYNATK